MGQTEPTRRPVGMRSAAWIQALARRMQRGGWRPNTVSLMSIVMAAGAAGCLLLVPRMGLGWAVAGLVAAPAFVALRGMCNLLDGLIAVEGQLRTRSGELFNDLPDRVSDLLMYAAAGYAVVGSPWGVATGWAAGALAIMTAYVRLLGGAMGARQYFVGPMAKTHRMAIVSVGCLGAAVEVATRGTTLALLAALGLIVAGCVVTVLRRARLIVHELENR